MPKVGTGRSFEGRCSFVRLRYMYLNIAYLSQRAPPTSLLLTWKHPKRWSSCSAEKSQASFTSMSWIFFTMISCFPSWAAQMRSRSFKLNTWGQRLGVTLKTDKFFTAWWWSWSQTQNQPQRGLLAFSCALYWKWYIYRMRSKDVYKQAPSFSAASTHGRRCVHICLAQLEPHA